MSKSSIAVKVWRKNVKLRAIDAGGGCCQICKYSKCPEALEFHHIDPNEKEFGFGKIVANPSSQYRIAKELEKCILLCANCHREFHNGDTELPTEYQAFNTELFIAERKRSEDDCPICGKKKAISLITCSRSCSAKKTNKVDWNSIDLFDLKVNQKLPNTKIAAMLGISDVAVKKRLTKLNIGSSASI